MTVFSVQRDMKNIFLEKKIFDIYEFDIYKYSKVCLNAVLFITM